MVFYKSKFYYIVHPVAGKDTEYVFGVLSLQSVLWRGGGDVYTHFANILKFCIPT